MGSRDTRRRRAWSCVKSASNSASGRPCGCSVSGWSRIGSTTFTTRTLQVRECRRRIARRERLQSRHVAAAGHHDVRLAALRSKPTPRPRCRACMDDCVVQREVVEGRLLARHHDVHVIAAPQTVVHDGEKRVRVWRQIHPDDLRLLVHDVVDEAGVLMRKPVVVLAPHVRGEEIVERGDRSTPRDLLGHLQPLRVLVEHRVDDVDEGLVTVEEPCRPVRRYPRASPGRGVRTGSRRPGLRAKAPRPWGLGPLSSSRGHREDSPRRLDAVSSGPNIRN